MIQPLNIAFVTIADLPEGAGNTSRLRRLAATLTAQGHWVEIWNEHALGISPPEALAPEGEIDGIPYRYMSGSTSRRQGFGMLGIKRNAVRLIARAMRQRAHHDQLDVVWFNNLSFYDVFPLTLLARRLGVRTIQSYEDERLELVSGWPSTASGALYAFNAWLADRCCPPMADAVVVISSYLREKYLRLGVAPERLHLVPTIIDCEAWRARPSSVDQPTTPVFLYSGSFSEQDEIDKLFEAFHLIRQRGLSFKVVMIGGNARNENAVNQAKDRIAHWQLSSHVTMNGFLPLAEVKKQISRSDILINLRTNGIWSASGLSTKLSEYLASGRPVIASTTGDVKKYLRDGESALLVDPDATPAAIARVLRDALASPERRRAIGAGGRAVALQHFDVRVQGDHLQAMLNQVMNKQG